MESRFATSHPESATNSWKTLGRYLTPLELNLHGGVGELVCFPSCKSDSDAHSYYFHQHEQSWQFVKKYLRNVVLCFFCNCSFHPLEFYYFTVFISVKTPECQRHLCWTAQKCSWSKIIPFLMFFPVYHPIVCHSNMMVGGIFRIEVLGWVECVTFRLVIYASWSPQKSQ